ncbi:hypothetical protein NDU88_003778 [Pleurodeles waltl]|uniref:PWI domain-containing protein n=2 Tax=Pleurodeles waltl TaxID=8319 RepID=A0AAV7NKT0_PLEWA|nr:hypothetical protein NDU88_003778 [Pleurodeles waltl]
MKMYVEDYKILQNWISGAVKNICDADPSALARYIIALLKKDKSEPELKSFLLDQLDMFLHRETYRFVDQLLVAVNDKSYLLPLEKLHSVPANVDSFQHPYKDIKIEQTAFTPNYKETGCQKIEGGTGTFSTPACPVQVPLQVSQASTVRKNKTCGGSLKRPSTGYESCRDYFTVQSGLLRV